MALQRTNKTIPIDGGIQNDADDFLLSEKNNAYVQNGVYRKHGVISKEENRRAIAYPGSDISDGFGGAVELSRTKLSLLHEDGATVYDIESDEFTNFSTTECFSVEKITTSDQTFDCVQVYGSRFTNGASFVAYEVHSPSQLSSPTLGDPVPLGESKIFIEFRDAQGVLTDKVTIEDAGALRVAKAIHQNSDNYNVFWCTQDGALLGRRIGQTGAFGPVTTFLDGLTDATRVARGPGFAEPKSSVPFEASWAQQGAAPTFPFVGTPDSYYRGHCRPGMAENRSFPSSQYAVCGVASPGLDPSVWILVKTQDGDIKMLEGAIVFGTGTLFTQTLDGDSGPNMFGVLDCQTNPEGDDRPFALYYQVGHGQNTTDINAQTPPNLYVIICERVEPSGGGSLLIDTNISLGFPIAGAVMPNTTSDEGWYAYSGVQAREIAHAGIRDFNAYGNSGTILKNTDTNEQVILVGMAVDTNMSIRDRGTQDDRLYFGIAEYPPASPEGSFLMKRGVQRVGTWQPFQKGRTSHIISFPLDFDADTTPVVAATLLAGTSASKPPTMMEQSPGKNWLDWDRENESPGFEFCGRQVIVPESQYLFVEDDRPHSNAQDGQNDLVRSAGGAVARAVLLRCDRVNAENRVRQGRKGDSSFWATARPLQVNRSGWSPFSVMGVPEIFNVSTQSDIRPFSLTYAPIKGSTDQTQMYIICGFTDQDGQVHRSSPGSLVYVDGIDFDDLGVQDRPVTVEFNVPFIEPRFQVWAELYVGMKLTEPTLVSTQTLASGALTGSITFNPFSPTSAGTNENVVGSRAGYTSGGALGADPWPCFRDIAFTSTRMWTIPVEFDGVVQYSKLFEDNVAPEFNAALNISFGNDRKVECISTLDDKVVVFERDRIHLIVGDGPTNLGTGTDFSTQLVSSDVGCTEPESVVETPEGLVFFSEQVREFVLLSRNLELIDIGKAVQDLTAQIQEVKSGQLVPDKHEVRWLVTSSEEDDLRPAATPTSGMPNPPPRPRVGRTLPDNSQLVFNYRMKKWSVLSGSSGVDGFYLNNNYGFLGLFGRSLALSSDDAYAQGQLSPSGMLVENPWIKLTEEAQDFKRLYHVTVLGRYLSDFNTLNLPPFGDVGKRAGDCQVTLKYDYEENGRQDVFRWRANRDFQESARDNWQFTMRPGRQKISSIKLIIEEIPTTKVELSEPDYTTGRGFEISAIDFVYGIKGAPNKALPAGRKK